jgi:hypothetical protein
MSVGVMKDYKLKLRNLHSSYTSEEPTGFLGGLEHLKIETRLINEKIPNTLSEYPEV